MRVYLPVSSRPDPANIEIDRNAGGGKTAGEDRHADNPQSKTVAPHSPDLMIQFPVKVSFFLHRPGRRSALLHPVVVPGLMHKHSAQVLVQIDGTPGLAGHE